MILSESSMDINMIVTNVTSVPILKTDLDGVQWAKWTHAKADLGNDQNISSAKAIEKLIDFYNNNKGRRVI